MSALASLGNAAARSARNSPRNITICPSANCIQSSMRHIVERQGGQIGQVHPYDHIARCHDLDLGFHLSNYHRLIRLVCRILFLRREVGAYNRADACPHTQQLRRTRHKCRPQSHYLAA
jgi:hypothetical protein